MIMQGDSREQLKKLADQSVRCCVTSPPYWGLRDYGTDGQIGLEQTPEEYVQAMVKVFREVRRVLTNDGTIWVNLGDSYANIRANTQSNQGFDNKSAKGGASFNFGYNRLVSGLKPKDLVGIPWMVAFALRSDGWYLRSDIIWNKPNCMPESVIDRPTKAHEYLFLLSKSERYFYNNEAIKEPITESSIVRLSQDIENQNGSDRANGGAKSNGTMKAVGNVSERNKRTVWNVSTANFSEAHFATFPPKLIEPCILAGSEQGDTVLDPFFGAGTTGLVAIQNNRKYIGIELNPEYIEIAKRRLEYVQPVMNF